MLVSQQQSYSVQYSIGQSSFTDSSDRGTLVYLSRSKFTFYLRKQWKTINEAKNIW